MPPGHSRVGIVDLGSNTARLVVYEFEPGKGYWLVDEIREQTRLGEGLAETGALGEAGSERALAALRLYRDYAKATGLEQMRLLATSAVREATNRDAFLARVRELGFDAAVVGGEREAELGVLAVANSFALADAWVMDLGGGSAQISIMESRRYARGEAHALGAVRLTEEFLHDDPPTPRQVERLEAAVDERLGNVLEEMRRRQVPLVAMGGTVRNLARAVRTRRGHRLAVPQGYLLERDDLEALTARMLSINAKRRGRMSGISSDRGDIILAGALVYRRIVGQAGLDGVRISGLGVREGAFYESFLPPPHLVPDVRRFTLDNLLWRYPQPMDHIERVRRMALQLFDGLRPLHGLGDEARELLAAAALLHDVGTVVSYLDHHDHGAYLLSSLPLNGYTHREQALLTLLVRSHRRGKPKTAPFGPLLRDGDEGLLWQLACCLRLAEHLERSRAGRVRDLEIELRGDEAVSIWLVSEEEPLVEFWETRKQASLFRRAFGRELQLWMR